MVSAKNTSRWNASRWNRILRGRLWWLVAIPVLLLATYVVVARQLMLLVPDYRQPLEELVSERLGAEIHIEQLHGRMDGLWPRFEMRGLTLPAVEGESPLTLGRVEVSVRVLPTLLHRQPYLRELLIDDVDVQLVRDSQGQIHLRGLEAFQQRQQKTDLKETLRTLYNQQRIVVQNARFSLDWPGLPPLAASSLNLALVNRGAEHTLSVRVQARDRPFAADARLRVTGNPLALEQLDARGYLDVEGERLQEWLPAERQWPLDVAELNGRVQLWASVADGRPTDATARLASPRVVLTDGKQNWPVNEVRLAAAMRGLDAEESQLSVTELAGTTRAGVVAPGPVALRWRHDGDSWRWRFHGEDLAIHALTQQLAQWPFTLPAGLRATRDRLRAQDPRGTLQALYLSGQDQHLHDLQARFAGLAMDAKDRIPGFTGVTGWVAGGPEQGVARVRGEPLQLTLAPFFDHPLSASFNGPVRWRIGDGRWQVESGTLMASNSDARGLAMARLRGGEGFKVPELSLLADLFDGNGAHASQYIPLPILPKGLADWLAQALRGGYLEHGRFLYNGPVKIDADRQQDRTFQMRFQGRDVSLSFLPDWPVASGIDADVLIDGHQVTASANRGTLFNSQVSGVTVDVPDVPDKAAHHIVIQGLVDGPASDLEQLFQDTPLKKQLPKELLDWHFQEGQMKGHLLLDIPLAHGGSAEPMVIVDGQADDVTLNNDERKLHLTKLSAPVYFHLKHGITLRTLKGDALGGHFQGSWLTQGPDSQMQLTGKVPVERLREWLGFDWLQPASGTLPVELDLGMPWRGSPFHLEARSTLKGVAVDAPVPLGKAANQARGSELALSTGPGAGQVSFHYGDVGQGRVRLGEPLAGTLRFGGGALPAMPARGLAIEGNTDRASAADWIEFVAGMMSPPQGAAASTGKGGAASGRDLINRVALTVGQLDLFGVPLNQVRFSAMPRSQDWELGLASPTVAGTLRLPEGYQARGDTPLTIKVDRLKASDEVVRAATGESLKKTVGGGDKGPPIAPTKLPIMDMDLRNLNIGGVDYGSWAGRIRPTGQGVVVHDLSGHWRHVDVDGELTWNQGRVPDDQHSRFRGTLGSSALAAAFQDFDLPPMLETKDANAKVDLAWNNWPLKPDYLALQGNAEVKIGECRIPEMDRRTSFLRVLGVLNIGTLQRRLRLDFSDLYKKGLSCDSITGQFAFQGPALTVTDLKIDSPSAILEVNGKMNLAEQSLDQQVKMILPISSNLYAGCLAGPAVCAGIFVVERLWGDKLDKTTSMDYHVSGPWKDPKVKETNGPPD